MSRCYKYFIAASVILTQAAAAQNTEKAAKPSPELNINVEKVIKEAEKKIKEAEITLKHLELNSLSILAHENDRLKALKKLQPRLEQFHNFMPKGPNPQKIQPEVRNEDFDAAGTNEKEKQITKTYKVTSKDKLSIQNQFGRITINTWTKNEIKVDILIIARETSDDRAQQLLDDVLITDSRQGSLISFKTDVKKGRSLGWWDSFRRKAEPDQQRGIEISYTVYMPSKNPLDISNSYGSVLLPDFRGPIKLSTSYSSLKAKDLTNSGNQLNLKYGSATIESFSGNLNLSYGSLNLKNGNKLTANISYGSTTIGKLAEDSDLNIKYTSNFQINEVGKNVDNLQINAAYSGIALGLDESSRYNYDVTVSYGGFKYNSDVVSQTISPATHDNPRMNLTKNYKGTYGKGSGNSRITIRSSYGGVKFL